MDIFNCCFSREPHRKRGDTFEADDLALPDLEQQAPSPPPCKSYAHLIGPGLCIFTTAYIISLIATHYIISNSD